MTILIEREGALTDTFNDISTLEDSLAWVEENVTQYPAIITPEIAKEWITLRNTNNRRTKPTTISNISKSLLLNEWKFNGEAIKFDWNGVLLDGQNRLHAIVATGVSAVVLVIEGLPPETQSTMDRGAKRILADILEWQGEKASNNLAAVLTLIHVTSLKGNRNVAANRPTDGQALKLLEEHPEIRDAVRNGHRIKNRLPLTTTIIATCWYFFSKLDEEENRDFWEAVTTGFYLPRNGENAKHVTAGSGPYLLNRYLHRERGNRQVPQLVKHAIVIKAWNMWRNGIEGKILIWRGSSEAFPEPI
jgi:hypothetical protein